MIRLNFDFLKNFCKNIYCQIIYGVENFQLEPCRFLWNKNSDVVFNYESKEKKKNGCGGMEIGVKVRNTEILTFLKIIILGVSCRILGQKVIIVSD